MVREHRMIDPFSDAQVRKTEKGVSVISYGLSSYGYDLRVSNEFKVFTNVFNTVVDPKAFDERSFVNFAADICVIPPNSFALARSVEYFRIPRDVLTVCLGKSTYARCGIIVNVTPLEPEWEGHVTLEISNTTPLRLCVSLSFPRLCVRSVFRFAVPLRNLVQFVAKRPDTDTEHLRGMCPVAVRFLQRIKNILFF